MSKTKVYKFLSENGHIRASAVVCTELINEVRTNQGTTPPSTLALSRALIGTNLLASQLKDGQALSVQFMCTGSMQMLFAQASYEGGCRAYIAEPELPMSVTEGKLALAPYVDGGTLTVSHYIKGQTVPQRSQVEIQSGEITEDLAHYLLTSQQVPCMLRTGLLFGSEGVVNQAAGILVELMPGHDDEDIHFAETSFQIMGELSQVLQAGMTGEDLLNIYFVGRKGKQWVHEHEIELTCSCRYERVLNSMKLLGKADLQDIVQKNESTEVSCQMCGRKYQVSVKDVKTLLEELGGLH